VRRAGHTSANLLLNALPPGERDRVLAAGARVPLRFKQVLYEDDERIDAVYFVEDGVVSLVTPVDDGRDVEFATVGREGMVGLPVFWGTGSIPNRGFVQVVGSALKISAGRFSSLAGAGTVLHSLLQRYTQVLFTSAAQGNACNRIHDIDERCARWILTTHDRVDNDTFELTQEFLAQMLGVRRSGVSAAAGLLQRAGYITYRRGRMTVRDRRGLESAACGCYDVVRRENERLLPQ
jgi:CRP-like cAMP-binding protein